MKRSQPIAMTLLLMATCECCSTLVGGERSDGATAEPRMEKTDLFEVGQEGYRSYRIPCLVVTGKNTVLAFCSGGRKYRIGPTPTS